MKNILILDSSARHTDNPTQNYNSISKQLGQLFIDKWMSLNHHYHVIQRDLSLDPPSFISQDWIAAAFSPPEKRTVKQRNLLAESDLLINELKSADLIIITTPMYNYGMPAALKAWFDQVIRINKTFSFDLKRGDFPLLPIMSGKTLVLLSSCGEFGFEFNGPRGMMNHLGPHIQLLSKYLGAENFHEIRCEYQEFADERHKQSLANARTTITTLVQKLSA